MFMCAFVPVPSKKSTFYSYLKKNCIQYPYISLHAHLHLLFISSFFLLYMNAKVMGEICNSQIGNLIHQIHMIA